MVREAGSVTVTSRFKESYVSCVVFPFRSVIDISDPLAALKTRCSPFWNVIVQFMAPCDMFVTCRTLLLGFPEGPPATSHTGPGYANDMKLPSLRAYFM